MAGLAVIGEFEAVEWRSMWGWIGIPSPLPPARAMSLRKVAAGHWRAAFGDKNIGRFGIVVNTLRRARSSGPRRGWVLGSPFLRR